RFDLGDAPLGEALLLARSVILGVLGEIAVTARFRDRPDDARALLALQAFELQAQQLGPAQCHRRALHVPTSRRGALSSPAALSGAAGCTSTSRCRSCRRFTSTSSM